MCSEKHWTAYTNGKQMLCYIMVEDLEQLIKTDSFMVSQNPSYIANCILIWTCMTGNTVFDLNTHFSLCITVPVDIISSGNHRFILTKASPRSTMLLCREPSPQVDAGQLSWETH